jgi:hypothetical protein
MPVSDNSLSNNGTKVNLSCEALQKEFHRLCSQPSTDPGKQSENLAHIIEQTADKALREPNPKDAARDFYFLRQEISELKENPEKLKSVTERLEQYGKSGDKDLPKIDLERGATGEVQYLYFHLTPDEIKGSRGQFPETFELDL